MTILERNASELLHNQGAGIVAGGDTLAYFKRYDRCQQPIAISSQRRMYFDLQGNVVHQVDMVQNMTSWDLSYYILRFLQLIALRTRSLPTDTEFKSKLRWRSKCLLHHAVAPTY